MPDDSTDPGGEGRKFDRPAGTELPPFRAFGADGRSGDPGRVGVGRETTVSTTRSPGERDGRSTTGFGTRTDGTYGGEDGPTEADDGRVYLVGAGPGDPALLTRRAWNLIENASVVMYDSLTGDRILQSIPESVELLDVGKRPPDRTSQSDINDVMVDRSRAGDRVVRLKGGDPTVFGRGGEEAQFLAEADVDFEIVPGISSVLAAPSVSGIPLTHRERSSSVTVITGHETPDKDQSALDWAALADTVVAGGTLVVLMGVSKLPENVAALRDHGVEPSTPAALVQKATWSEERTVVGTLQDIVTRAEDVEPPAVTVVGDVVGVREDVAERLA